MASNVSYLKGVRTRYINILKKQTQIGLDLLESAKGPLINEAELSIKIGSCIERLQMYSDKVESQTEKLADAIDSKDTELTNQLVTENESVCDKALECVLNLKEFKEEISLIKVKKAETKEKYGFDQIVELQKQMNTVVVNQMKQQSELIEKQELKDKELATTVKLPKIDIVTFTGNKLRWTEFWDSFECAIHNNKKLSNIEKFNYLNSKVGGEAKSAILGLALSNENYQIAVDILKDRFGDSQEVIDLHYNKMINLHQATNKTSSLRSLYDNMERHIRSLEVLKQDIKQDVFVSMIRAKLPEEVLLQLEILNGSKNKWTVQNLRDRLHEYITAREHAEKKGPPAESTFKRDNYAINERKSYSGATSGRVDPPRGLRRPTFGPNTGMKQHEFGGAKPRTGTAEALVANTKQMSVTRHYDQCRYCEKRHWSDECPTYRTVQQRKKQLKDSCYKCLKVGHLSKECKRNKACVHCGEVNAHHRSLCPKKFNNSNISSIHLTEEVCEMSESGECITENALVSSEEIVLMQTAKTEIKNKSNSKSEQVRILLDSGSQRTYVTESLAKRLQLIKEGEEEIKLVTFGSEKPKVVKTSQTKLSIMLNNGEYLDITANIVPVISGTVQRKAMNLYSSRNIDHLVKSLDMADSIPSETESSTVDLLIGNDYYLDIILTQKIEVQPGLYLLASKLGWILTGRSSEFESEGKEMNMLILTYGDNITSTNVFQSLDDATPTKPNLEDFWNMESIGVSDRPETTIDETIKTNFKETLQFKDGRYQVKWPWKEKIPDLPENRDLAMGRLKSCVFRMATKPDLMKQYNSIIQDQLEKGVIEKVDKSHTNEITHYLPHHAVINPLKPTTKIRIVYDASAKTRRANNSLNECLYRGPVLMNDLCGLLMRFRLNNIALVADIEKAFLQIGLQQDQRDVTRFIWLKDCETSRVEKDNIQEYRFCRVPFGIISSPFLLAATIENHLESYESEIASKLKSDIYVDNLITGTDTIEEALQLYKESKSMFSEASMNLREWVSNDKNVNQFIDSVDRASCETMTVLGHTWNTSSDTIVLKEVNSTAEHTNPTKRNVLKEIASVFDPLGICSPVQLKGKLFLQTLWSKHIDWDDAIGDEDTPVWLQIKSEITKLATIQIKRCITTSGNPETSNYFLACFCDASACAFATVVYLIQRNSDDKAVANMLFSKTRLAPLKNNTIPRLELMAVVIGVRCLSFVKSQIKVPIAATYLWTDSQCVLKWIVSKKDVSVFVRNRVKEIKSHSDIVCGFVTSKENPADIASRGTTVQNLRENELWWHGPSWLTDSEQEWPSFVGETNEKTELEYESEVKKTKSVKETGLLNTNESISGTYSSGSDTPLGINIERFSSLTKLIRVTAIALRFISRLRDPKSRNGTITSCELIEAERMWLTYSQKRQYSDVYKAISNGKTNNLQKQLGLYIDNEGLLRCKGRIEHANLSESARRPLLLPKNDKLTHLQIEKIHKETLHSGVSQTLSYIRHKYWIPHGRAVVRSILRNCLVCRRQEGGPYKMPVMPPLPKTRVTEATPFSRTGLDYLGPLYIKSRDDSKKVWICLFTCLVTRAIHLELLQDMSTGEFLLGFRRFTALRGCPSEIISDNSLTFKTASKALDLVWSNVIKCEEVQTHVANKGVKWIFIVELAPWMGGFYERLVGLVKRALRKTISRKLLTYVQLETILKEVIATVNARPLVYVSDDINSSITLTPAHFLTLNPNTGIPELEYKSNDPDYNPYESTAEKLLQVWKKGQRLLNAFWKTWRDEYLLSLRERTQSKLKSGRVQSEFSVNIGDVVSLKEDVPRGCWKLGKVTHLVPSFDGNVRSAEVLLSSGRTVRRPLNLLYPIEVTTDNDSISGRDETSPISKQKKIKHPVREAASVAKSKIKMCF